MDYTIFDRNIFTNSGEFVLQGAHYHTLIKHCLKYSAYFSLFSCRFGSPLDEQLSKWRIPHHTANANEDSCLVFYKSCEETCKLLTQITHSFFDFQDETNIYTHDITFYRSDGTVFMETILHEGECSIYPREDENVDELLSFGNWLFFNDDGVLDVPAAEHPFPAPQIGNVVADPLYTLLQEIREAPEIRLPSATMENLEQFIQRYRPLGFPAEDIGLNPRISALPRWYISFMNFVQGKNNCSTATKITKAICGDKYDEYGGFSRFYELLDEYVQDVCIQKK